MSKLYSTKTIIGTFVLLSANYCYAHQSYIGFEIGNQNNGFRKGHGQEIFANKSSFVDINIGKMFQDKWGLEFGISIIPDKKQSSIVIGSSTALPGRVLTPGFNHITHSEIQKRALYVGLIRLYPITAKFKLFNLVGFSHSWMRQSYTPSRLHNVNLTLSEQAAATRTFKSHGKNIHLKFGAKYDLTDSVGIKTTITWDNTARFKSKCIQSPNLPDSIRHKNATRIGVGLYFQH